MKFSEYTAKEIDDFNRDLRQHFKNNDPYPVTYLAILFLGMC